MDGRPRTTRPRLSPALAAASLLALTACTGTPAPEAFVTRLADERTSTDEIAPRFVPDGAQPDSSRLLVDHDGVRFYVAASTSDDGDAVCLVLVVPADHADDDGGGSACRSLTELDDDGVRLDLVLSDPGVRVDAVLVPDGTTPVTDLPALTPNLFATVSWQA